MKSFSAMKKVVGAGLLVSLAGSGLAWAAFGSEAEAAGTRTGVLSIQEVDEVAQGIALMRWRDYMRSIGWNEDRVQVTHPEFVNAVSTKERLADGGWKLVFDGTREGELRMVTMQLDDRGNEVGETMVEWADLCMAAEFVEGGH